MSDDLILTARQIVFTSVRYKLFVKVYDALFGHSKSTVQGKDLPAFYKPACARSQCLSNVPADHFMPSFTKHFAWIDPSVRSE
jgi:hypothetical protein